MRKNHLRLFLLIAFLFIVYSCVHDEVYSAENAATVEYHSKSLWKEDEKYIKNIIKIYSEHESEIKRVNGVPLWDYAMSMGKYDETFMVVPIVENNKVVSTLSCARFDKKVYFKYENSEKNNEFFNSIIFGKYTQVKPAQKSENDNTSSQKGSICVTQSVSLWYPNSETDPNSGGHWETNYYTNCYSYLDYSDPSWESGGSGGFDYGGGGGSTTDPNNPQNLTPCEKTKNLITKPQVKDSLDTFKAHAQTNTKEEKGFQELKSGTLQPGTVAADNQIFFGIGQNSLGTVHTHQPKTIGIFAPQDIMTFLHIVREQDINNLGNAYSGTVSSSGTYFINFTGATSDLPPAMTETQEAAYVSNLVTAYEAQHDYLKYLENLSYNQKLSNIGLEKLFFNMLGKMGLSGKIELIKEENGNISTIKLNSNGLPVPNPCQ